MVTVCSGASGRRCRSTATSTKLSLPPDSSTMRRRAVDAVSARIASMSSRKRSSIATIAA
jgi:hypothetical protein